MTAYYRTVLDGTINYVNGLFKPEEKQGADGENYKRYSCELLLDKNSFQPATDEYGKIVFNDKGEIQTVPFETRHNDLAEAFHTLYQQACKPDDKGVVQFAGMKPDDERWFDRITIPIKDGDEDKFGKNSRHFDELRKDVYPEYANTYFLNMSTTTDPNEILVDTSTRPARKSPGLGVLYSGAQVRVSVTFATYATPQGNKGIKVMLNYIQKLADGERLGGGGMADPMAALGLSDDIFVNPSI